MDEITIGLGDLAVYKCLRELTWYGVFQAKLRQINICISQAIYEVC